MPRTGHPLCVTLQTKLQHKNNVRSTMKNITFTTMRNRALRRACREAMKETGASSPAEVIDRVIHEPVPRGFFVSVDHAIEMDRKHRAGTLPKLAKGKDAMWEEVFRAVERVQRRHPQMNRCDVVCQVISKATCSRFYLSRREALKICRHVHPDDDYWL